MSFLRRAVMSLSLLALTPAAARADGMIIPFFGTNFGGDAGQELSDGVDADRFTWGASFTFMGGGVVGVEGDIGYSPDFFGKTDLGGSSVLTLTGNLLLGVPFGGQSGFGVRPYALVGVGVVRPDREEVEEDLLDFGEYKPAWNFGGGVMMFFASHVGVRADVRYFRTFEAVELLPIDEEPGEDLDFTRGSVGLILRF